MKTKQELRDEAFEAYSKIQNQIREFCEIMENLAMNEYKRRLEEICKMEEGK